MAGPTITAGLQQVGGAVVSPLQRIGGESDTGTYQYVGGQTGPIGSVPVVVAGTAPGGTVGSAYSTTFTASGGQTPYTFAATGTVPPGLTLSSSGVLSGTPTTAGTDNFSVVATDANAVVSAPLSQTVAIAASTGPTSSIEFAFPAGGPPLNIVKTASSGTFYYERGAQNGASGNYSGQAAASISVDSSSTAVQSVDYQPIDLSSIFYDVSQSGLHGRSIVPINNPANTAGKTIVLVISAPLGTGTILGNVTTLTVNITPS
jgi:hypothetical protein